MGGSELTSVTDARPSSPCFTLSTDRRNAGTTESSQARLEPAAGSRRAGLIAGKPHHSPGRHYNAMPATPSTLQTLTWLQHNHQVTRRDDFLMKRPMPGAAGGGFDCTS